MTGFFVQRQLSNEVSAQETFYPRKFAQKGLRLASEAHVNIAVGLKVQLQGRFRLPADDSTDPAAE